MPRVINFFPKQVVAGVFASQDNVYYSEVFDISDITKLTAELRVYRINPRSSGTGITGYILESSDPALDPNAWTVNPTSIVVHGDLLTTKKIYSDLQRFVRAQLTLGSGILAATIAFEALGRETS